MRMKSSTDRMKQSYAEALNLLELSELERAREQLMVLLKEVTFHPPSLSLIYYTLGLVELNAGYPARTLAYWEKVCDQTIRDIATKKAIVTEQQHIYTEKEMQYFSALALIENKQYDEALERIELIIKDKDDRPLPVEYYYAYLLTLVLKGEGEQVETLVNHLPMTIQKASEIKTLTEQLQAHKVEASNESESHQQNQISGLRIAPVYKRLVFVGALVGAMAFGSLTNQFLNESNVGREQAIMEDSEAPVYETGRSTDGALVQSNGEHANDVIDQHDPYDQHELNEQVIELQAEVDRLFEVETQLKHERDEHIAVIEQLASVVGAHEKLLLALSYTNQAIDEVQLTAARELYREGYLLYQGGQYDEAIVVFNKSFELEKDAYFADDNLFFYIQSLHQLSEYEEMSTLIDWFLNEEKATFAQSPYVDDVLLLKARFLAANKQYAEALLAIAEIEERFASHWTAVPAKQLKKAIMEDM